MDTDVTRGLSGAVGPPADGRERTLGRNAEGIISWGVGKRNGEPTMDFIYVLRSRVIGQRQRRGVRQKRTDLQNRDNGCYRCCAESLHCNPPLFQSVDP